MKITPHLLLHSIAPCLFSILVIACNEDPVFTPEQCSVSTTNEIENLIATEEYTTDSLIINFKNSQHRLVLYANNISSYSIYMPHRTRLQFTNFEGSYLQGAVTLYHAGDSAYFNNASYLGKFEIQDDDTPNNQKADSLNFISQCFFKLHLNLVNLAGEEFKTVNQDNLDAHFHQIDSIQYVLQPNIEFTHYKVFSHFKTTLVNDNNEVEPVSGRLIMNLAAKRN